MKPVSSSSSESSMEASRKTAPKYELLDKKKPPEPLTSSTDSSIEVPNKRSDTKYELLDKKRRKSKKTEKPTTIVIEKDIVKKDTKAAKREALTKKGSTLLKKADGEEEEKHVEARLEVEKVPGSGGEEDEINIGMEVVVDPDGPNPMTTYVEAQVAEDVMA